MLSTENERGENNTSYAKIKIRTFKVKRSAQRCYTRLSGGRVNTRRFRKMAFFLTTRQKSLC